MYLLYVKIIKKKHVKKCCVDSFIKIKKEYCIKKKPFYYLVKIYPTIQLNHVIINIIN